MKINILEDNTAEHSKHWWRFKLVGWRDSYYSSFGDEHIKNGRTVDLEYDEKTKDHNRYVYKRLCQLPFSWTYQWGQNADKTFKLRPELWFRVKKQENKKVESSKSKSETLLELAAKKDKTSRTQLKKLLKEELDTVRRHMEDYHLLRYIVSVVEDKEKTEDVLHSIAYWMSETKHDKLPFNDIFVVDDEVYIYTCRPGLWIGKAGCTIDSCQHSINHKVDGTKYRDLHLNLIEVRKDATAEIYGYMHVLMSDDWFI